MYDEVINQLKTAAEKLDWDSYLKALRSIVCKVDKDALVNLIFPYVHIFMLSFIEHDSQHKPKYEAIFTNHYEEEKPAYLVGVSDILKNSKGEPGINNSLKGISKLETLLDLDDCHEVFIDTFLLSITNLLIAIPSRSWGIQNQTLYRQWLEGTSNEDLLILARYYARDPKQIAESKILLHKFANNIEKLLQSDSELS